VRSKRREDGSCRAPEVIASLEGGGLRGLAAA